MNAQELIATAHESGFPLVGIVSVDRYFEAIQADRSYFDEWLAKRYHGTMTWLERQRDRRFNRNHFKDYKSILVVARPYNVTRGKSWEVKRPWISQYARWPDYHETLESKLDSLVSPAIKRRIYVDTGPVFERKLAALAGLGWIGKNTCLINKQLGSFLFLAEIFVDLELAEITALERNRCGTCRRCMEACPAKAIVAPGEIDCRKCVSYLTIEHKGAVAPELHRAIGNNLFGCDICQEVCPWNEKTALQKANFPAKLSFCDLPLPISSAQFDEVFSHTPLRRLSFSRFLRNVEIVQKQLGSQRP